MDASHPLIPEVGRVELDPRGPTASKCQEGRASSSQANRRVRDEEAGVPTALGRYGDGRDRRLAADAGEVSGTFRQSRAVPGGDGGLRRLAALGAPDPGPRSRGPASAGEDGAALRGRQQERCARRAGDLDGGAAARRQDGCDQERGTAGNPGAASHAPATGEVPHRPDQRPARSVDRIWRGHAERPSRDEAGHPRGP